MPASAALISVWKSSISHLGRASPVKWMTLRCSPHTPTPASSGSKTDALMRGEHRPAAAAGRVARAVEAVDPGVLSQARGDRVRLVAAVVGPPEVEPFVLERLVQPHVCVTAGARPVEHLAAHGQPRYPRQGRRRSPRTFGSAWTWGRSEARPARRSASARRGSSVVIEGCVFSPPRSLARAPSGGSRAGPGTAWATSSSRSSGAAP